MAPQVGNWTLASAVIAISLLLWMLRTAIKLSARQKYFEGIGIPVYISPFNASSIAWFMTYPWLVPRLKIHLPTLWTWVRFNYPGWSFQDKYKIHLEAGSIFACVHPDENAVFISDPIAVPQLFSLRCFLD